MCVSVSVRVSFFMGRAHVENSVGKCIRHCIILLCVCVCVCECRHVVLFSRLSSSFAIRLDVVLLLFHSNFFYSAADLSYGASILYTFRLSPSLSPFGLCLFPSHFQFFSCSFTKPYHLATRTTYVLARTAAFV